VIRIRIRIQILVLQRTSQYEKGFGVLVTIRAGASRRPLSPVLTAILHELLKAETFSCLADLKDALCVKASRLHIRYTGPDVDVALAAVGHVRPLLVEPARRNNYPITTGYKSAITRADAKALLDKLGIQL
jgi:hypothetical protein